ncbi:MAG TPA: hypothetical protein VFC31_08855 [Candidatus Limnocylindria bacterium]|nr:hypothetical protein [Candidatus Limnocylindria bacterium]
MPDPRQRIIRIGLGPEPDGRWAKLRHRVNEILWGFFVYEFWHGLHEERSRYADALNVLIMGELLGIPLMNSTVTLHLLPYMLPDLKKWKERQLEDTEVLERAPEIH